MICSSHVLLLASLGEQHVWADGGCEVSACKCGQRQLFSVHVGISKLRGYSKFGYLFCFRMWQLGAEVDLKSIAQTPKWEFPKTGDPKIVP